VAADARTDALFAEDPAGREAPSDEGNDDDHSAAWNAQSEAGNRAARSAWPLPPVPSVDFPFSSVRRRP